MIAELFTGNTPLFAYFHPIFFALLTAFYGSAALLVRELTIRWRKGWPTVFTLGVAFGILEEGLSIRSFFNPSWPALGSLGHYGRFLGINWLWTAQLMLQHSVVSIAIPVLLVSVVYRDRWAEAWVGTWMRRLLWVLLGVASLLIAQLFRYPAPPGPYLFWAAVAAVLFVMARFLPRHLLGFEGEPRPSVRGPRPIWYLILGFGGVAAMYQLPQHTPIPAVIDYFLVWIAAGAFGVAVIVMSKRGRGWGDSHRVALASGALAFYFAISPLRGQPITVLVSVVGAIALVWVFLRTRRNEAGVMAVAPKVL